MDMWASLMFEFMFGQKMMNKHMALRKNDLAKQVIQKKHLYR